MDILEAIAEMRKLSKEGKSFSFTFMTYSLSRNETKGIVEVKNTRLKPRRKVEHNLFAQLLEEYVNTPQRILFEAINTAIGINWLGTEIKMGFSRKAMMQEGEVSPKERFTEQVLKL